jgi:hypothetical protein
MYQAPPPHAIERIPLYAEVDSYGVWKIAKRPDHTHTNAKSPSINPSVTAFNLFIVLFLLSFSIYMVLLAGGKNLRPFCMPHG